MFPLNPTLSDSTVSRSRDFSEPESAGVGTIAVLMAASLLLAETLCLCLSVGDAAHAMMGQPPLDAPTALGSLSHAIPSGLCLVHRGLRLARRSLMLDATESTPA